MSKTARIIIVFCIVAAIASPAQTFKILVSFNDTDGEYPTSPLVQGLDGDFYGTTSGGGTHFDGTVFKVTPAGMLTTLYNFCSQASCADGGGPADLVLATDGNFYGTTGGGGTKFAGTVFKITPGGTLTTLYTFCSQADCADGNGPHAGLVQDPDGNFYGTTQLGGASSFGTVFKITPAGKLTTLHRFEATDGIAPYAGLVMGSDGKLYGTTYAGGDQRCWNEGCGTVFAITMSGTLTTLHRFDQTDGAHPLAGLVQASDGHFYGTTANGGTYNICRHGCGTIFKITAAGALTTLHNFKQNDGGHPAGGLRQATDGNFYGSAAQGGNKYGTIYKFVYTSGRRTLTTLHKFDGTDGASPGGSLLQATNGSFYGVAAHGGGGDCSAYGCGTAFRLSVGLQPFVRTLPTSSKVGRAVSILGNELAGATGVTFNGTAAMFKVVSNTEIKTTVPSAATTGFVTVTTPKGTLKSNVVFRILP